MQKKIDEPGHTEQFVSRNQRLQQEALEKIAKSVQAPIVKLQISATELNLSGEPVRLLLAESTTFLEGVNKILSHDPEVFREVVSVDEG